MYEYNSITPSDATTSNYLHPPKVGEEDLAVVEDLHAADEALIVPNADYAPTIGNLALTLKEVPVSAPEALSLEEEFRFSLNGHELKDPETNKSRVISEPEPVSPIVWEGHIIPVYNLEVEDTFVAADPEGFAVTTEVIERQEARMIRDGFDPLTQRTEAFKKSRQNPYTQAWRASEESGGLDTWHDLKPTAPALSPIHHPYVGTSIDNLKGRVVPMSPEAAAIFRFTADGIGIRSRAAALEFLAARHLSGLPPEKTVKWLCLAGGTAEPSIEAANRARDSHGIQVDLTIADQDKNALALVEHNAEKLGFSGAVIAREMNILVPDLAEQIANPEDENGQYDVAEAMGFIEYLPQEGDEIEAKAAKVLGLPQASEFIKNAVATVKPGGAFFTANMTYDRPQLKYVLGAVDWELLNARSDESMLRAHQHVIDNPNLTLEMYRIKEKQTGYNIYNIFVIKKLA